MSDISSPDDLSLSALDQQLQEVLGAPIDIPTDYVPPSSALPSVAPLGTDESGKLPTDPRLMLQRVWGYPDFRGIQRDIIDSILEGRDTLGLMPTGGGKSLTFQVPAMMMEGTCLVITPLIALMKDQVEHLRKKGIRATAIHSGLSRDEINQELNNVILGRYKFLYLSPERLHTDLFQLKLNYMKISFIAVDEAHCISQWGYDFRPSYLQLKEIRQLLPHTPILALTATATDTVVDDIQEQLRFREKRVFRMSFARPNLTYLVQLSDDKMGDLIHLLEQSEGSAIVYTRSRGGTRDTALALQAAGLSALYYHAGLPTTDKTFRQESWQRDEARVMVATNAFGMGIDKPDVRLVVHLDPPDSIEAYFQEAGRAGRDGAPARAILLFNARDTRSLTQRIGQTFPAKDKVREIYADVAYYLQVGEGEAEGKVREFDLEKFCIKFKHFPLTVVNAFTILERAGYLSYSDKHDTRSRVMMIVQRDELYRIHHRVRGGDKILTALLRHYTGLFSDYIFIEEATLAQNCDLTENEVYHALKALNAERVIHYIPRKSVATITYLFPRVETQKLALTPEVYEERLAQYEHRINSMVNYCTDSTNCRSQLLLAYFDETHTIPCGHCDVCQQHPLSSLSSEEVSSHILHLLGDGQGHSASEFRFTHIDEPRVQEAIAQLLDAETIHFDGALFYKT